MEGHGTIRGKYEYQTTTDEQRFQVRNARISLDGKVHELVGYKAEIDLSDEGQIKMLDAYARITPMKDFNVTIGQMRVPFTIDAHRSPHQQYFANRSFIAKQVGNVRDVGATLGYTVSEGFPLVIEGGLFSGSGLTQQKEWHRILCYSAKLQLMPWENYNLTLSTQRIRPAETNIYMYDAGTYYEWNNWHFEVEGLYKHYDNHMFSDVQSMPSSITTGSSGKNISLSRRFHSWAVSITWAITVTEPLTERPVPTVKACSPLPIMPVSESPVG